MLRSDGKTLCFVDFGSSIVDFQQNNMIPKTAFFPKAICSPIVYKYFAGKEFPRIGSSSLLTNLGFSDYAKFYKISEDTITNKYLTQEDLFNHYMMHKNDCFDLAYIILRYNLIFKNSENDYYQNGGNIFTKCFKIKDSNSICQEPITPYIKERITLLRPDLPEYAVDILAELLSVDVENFHKFKAEYEKNRELKSVSYAGGKKKTKKQIKTKTPTICIRLTENSKQYKVNVDNKKQKFIMRNKKKLYLKEIRGKYRYV
jgi:hypothetical protein